MCACIREREVDGWTDRQMDRGERERENTSYNYTSYFCGLKSQGKMYSMQWIFQLRVV